MAIKKENQQVYTTLPRCTVDKIDGEASKNHRTRSKEIAYIIQQHYKMKENDL